MQKPTVVCTLPIDPAGIALLEPFATVIAPPDDRPDTLRAAVAHADALIVRTMLPPDIFAQAQRMIACVRNGSGLDMIPVDAATAAGIAVANVPGANAQAVVEYCIGAMLRLARPVTAMDRALRTDGWAHARARSATAFELAGKTVGIVGLGAIGAGLARVCRDGFGMRVLGAGRPGGSVPAGVEAVELDELIASCDVLSLNCPLTPETTGLLDERRLRSMRTSAFVINASRGAVIDEAALIKALSGGWIAGAALDVFAVQPLAADSPLLRMDNVVLTPHAAALTIESNQKMSAGAARQVVQLLHGERPEYLVNAAVWDRFLARRTALGWPA